MSKAVGISRAHTTARRPFKNATLIKTPSVEVPPGSARHCRQNAGTKSAIRIDLDQPAVNKSAPQKPPESLSTPRGPPDTAHPQNESTASLGPTRAILAPTKHHPRHQTRH